MMIFDIDYTLFSIAGQHVSLIELCSVLTGLCCVFLATKGKVANFWVGYLYNILLFTVFIQKHLYSSMMLQPISLAINFFGHYRWTHPRSGEEDRKKQLKITLMTWRQRLYAVLAISAFTILWGLLLSNLDNIWPDTFPAARQPYLDAFVTSMILTAQYLAAQKKLDCWAVWFMVNITNGILYIKAGLAFLPVVALGYLIIATFGFTMWRREWKAEADKA